MLSINVSFYIHFSFFLLLQLFKLICVLIRYFDEKSPSLPHEEKYPCGFFHVLYAHLYQIVGHQSVICIVEIYLISY